MLVVNIKVTGYQAIDLASFMSLIRKYRAQQLFFFPQVFIPRRSIVANV